MIKIIIPNENGSVSEHFGHASKFTLLEVEDNKVVKKTDIDPPEHQPGILPRFFHEKGIDLVITGGMGSRAIELFKEFNIGVIVGIKGSINDVIQQFLQGELQNGKSTCHGSHQNCNHK
jgi:predicted Fe-Mo cluster-binding NifX family protein